MSTNSVDVVASADSAGSFTAPLPVRRRVSYRFCGPAIRAGGRKPMPDRPRVVRMPSDWWEGPSVATLPLGSGRQVGKNARRFTRDTFARWGLQALTDDAEVIVSELVANAVKHAGVDRAGGRDLDFVGVRLFRRPGEVVCAILDPSDGIPVLREPSSEWETGRGLQLVDALSDVWGWSPVAGRGKAVWAILFCNGA